MAQEEATLLLKIKETGSKALNILKNSLDLVKGAVAALAAAAGLSIKAFREEEQAVNALNQSMLNAGIFSEELSKKYLDQAAALEKLTTFEDNAIISAQAIIQGYVGQIEVTEELTKATLDFATAQKVDLDTAAKLLGKTIGSNTNGLAKYGIEVDSTASKSEKMAQVIDAVNQRFGGQAAAAAKGLGVLDQLRVVVGNVFEALGQRLAPITELFANQLKAVAEAAQSGNPTFEAIVDIFEFMSKAIMIAKFGLTELGIAIGNVFGFLVNVGEAAVTGSFTKLKTNVSLLMSQISSESKSNWSRLTSDLESVDKAFLQRREAGYKISEQQIQASKEAAAAAEQARLEEEMLTLDTKLEEQLIKEITAEQILQDEKLRIQLENLQMRLEAETSASEQFRLLKEKERILTEQTEIAKRKQMTTTQQLNAFLASEEFKTAQTGAAALVQLQQSKHASLRAIGKAAALAQIAMDTARGAVSAYSALAMIPFVGPALGAAAALAVIAFGVEQSAKVVGLESGGIVQARAGGTPAILGEGGRDEAVIPLGDNGQLSGVGGTTINFNGPVMADEFQARQFALMIDRERFKLAQNRESLIDSVT